jgi:hypothetical protein
LGYLFGGNNIRFANLVKKKASIPTSNGVVTNVLTPAPLVGTPILPFADSDADKLFDMVNEYKKTLRLPTSVVDDEVCRVAQQIIGANFENYKQPKVSEFNSDCPTCAEYAVTFSQNNTDLISVLNMWSQDDVSKEAINNDYKYRCVKVKDTKIVLVMANKSLTPINYFTSSKTTIECNYTYPKCGTHTFTETGNQCPSKLCCLLSDNEGVFVSSEEECKARAAEKTNK